MKTDPRRLLVMALLVTSGFVHGAGNPGAHQHGQGQLQLAMAGQQVELRFVSPAHNLLGFEHNARTAEQQAQVETVVRWLSDTPLIDTPASTCTIESVRVQTGMDGSDHDHATEHSAQHSDFEVNQELDCPGLDPAGSLTTPLPDRFPGLDRLDIAWTGPGGQGAARLTGGDHRFRATP